MGTLQFMDYGKIDYADENGNLDGTLELTTWPSQLAGEGS